MKNAMQLNTSMGRNKYPDSLEETMNIINMHQQAKWIPYIRHGNKENSKEMTFAQKGKEKDTGDLSKITCYHCGEQGH